MNFKLIWITALLCTLLVPGLIGSARAYTRMMGEAALSYTKYEADLDGKDLVSGSTFAQQYSLGYKASNLRHRSQPRYYDLMVGYEWMSFDTSLDTSPGSDLNLQQKEFALNQTFGKFVYSGEVGYAAAELPITVRAYSSDNDKPIFKYNLAEDLLNSGLIYNLQGRGTYRVSGATFAFEPRQAREAALRGLPRLLIDYREMINKSDDSFFRVDSKTRELAVAGLSQENNWINFRRRTYENYLDPLDKYTMQQLQIGLVDHRGRRLWSALTNWIQASADGQLTNVNSPAPDKVLEEYDVNLMLIATRRLWSARTFMNYNRQLDDDGLTESTSVPLYVKGLYGSDTDWYVRLAADRSRQKTLYQPSFNTSASYTMSAGATTFKHSSFTLSPSIGLQTTKSYYGIDSYRFNSGLESNSTRRFSNKLGLAGKISFQAADDGNSRAESESWSTRLDLTATYAPSSSFSYKLQDILESGSGRGNLESSWLFYGDTNRKELGTYLRNYTFASAKWMPSSKFTTSLEASYDFLQATDLRPTTATTVIYQISYSNQAVSSRLDSKYVRIENGYDPARYVWISNAELLYRPDRYNDGLLRLKHEREFHDNLDRARVEILQRYNYNFFTRVGLLRNLATLTEEYSYASDENSGTKASSQYLLFSGRYNPTERLSLFAAVKYQKNDPGSVVMYYNAGLNADFKLLSTSLDYAYAKRDTDNKVEKRFNATVRRTF